MSHQGSLASRQCRDDVSAGVKSPVCGLTPQAAGSLLLPDSSEITTDPLMDQLTTSGFSQLPRHSSRSPRHGCHHSQKPQQQPRNKAALPQLDMGCSSDRFIQDVAFVYFDFFFFKAATTANKAAPHNSSIVAR